MEKDFEQWLKDNFYSWVTARIYTGRIRKEYKRKGYPDLESFVNTTVDGERKINVRYYKTKLSQDEIIERAKSRLGERKYNALFNNCEHFAYWCRGYDDFKN